MNILIELPSWLGDGIMTTPSIEEIVKLYPDIKITFFGSFVSCEAFKAHPNCHQTIYDDSKKSILRLFWLYKSAKKLGKFNMAISFRGSLYSNLFLKFLKTKKIFQYKKKLYSGHQVEKYAKFVSDSLNISFKPNRLKLHQNPFKYSKKTVGLNPGATYGSAKRWYPKEFAKVANTLSKDYGYDIIIFGGYSEIDMAKEIEDSLSIKNYQNLARKTSVQELIQKIAGLDLFITNDSGPMHIAAAYQVPTITLFGSTKQDETDQWHNPNSYIINHNLSCAPCMKRICPLKHHDCMKGIKAQEVVKTLEHHLLLGK